MPIDPNIALQVKQPQFESPLRSAGQAMQLRGLMGQQEMQGLQMEEMRRANDERKALRALLAEGGDMATLPERLMRGGHVEAGLKFQKANLENRKTTADIGKTELEAGALATKTFADTMAGVTDQASYQGAMSALAQNPAFVPMLKQLPQQWTPEFGQQAVRQAMIAHGKIADTLAKNANRDIGGVVQTVRTDPITGAEQVVGEIAKTSTPDALMRDATTRSEGAAGRGVTMRGQNMTDARSVEANRINAGTASGTVVDRLRVEFNKLPEVEAYKSIIPAQKSAQDAIARDTPQADINLIYATAKIFDPMSVVREGEYATVSNSQAPAERVQGMISYLMSGGKLTANTRRQLLAEIDSRAAASKTQYDAARKSYEGIVKGRGVTDPGLVFQTLDEAPQTPLGATAPAAPKMPSAEAKPVTVNGRKMTATLAPDGKYYVKQPNGKYAEVTE